MFATAEDIKANTNYEDVKNLDNKAIEGYMLRADIWIHSATNYDYSKSKDEIVKNKLKIATIRLVDYLFYFDKNPKQREKLMQGLQSETMPDYSYSFRTSVSEVGEPTGDPELDVILSSLKVETSGFNFFRVSNKRSGLRGIR